MTDLFTNFIIMDTKKYMAERTISDANILSIRLDHNGFCGGDAGHGGYVNITIADESCSCLHLNGKKVQEFEFGVNGDSERRTLLEALKFVIKHLEEDV